MSHVTAYIGFIGNDKAGAKFQAITDELNKVFDSHNIDHGVAFADVLWGKKGISNAEAYENFRELSWIKIRDPIEDEIYIFSGPRPPQSIVEKIAEIITQEDPDAIITMTYFDDEEVFYGALVAYSTNGKIECYDDEEYTADDEMVCWSYDVDDYKAEHGSDVKIVLWEKIHDETHEMLQDAIGYIMEERNINV